MRQYFVITNEICIYIYKIIIKLCLPFLRLIIISHLFSLFSILFSIDLKHNCKQTCACLACLQFNSNSFTQRKNTLWPQKCRSLISIRSLTDFHSIGNRQTRKSRGWCNSSPRIGEKKTSPCVCATTEYSVLLLTLYSKVNTPGPSRNWLRHMVGGWEEGNTKDLTKSDRKCRDWKTFGYVWKELYVGGRNAHVEKKRWLADVCKLIHNPHFKRKNTMSKQTNFNINYFFNY